MGKQRKPIVALERATVIISLAPHDPKDLRHGLN
jgi:hypothetical protein